MKFMELAEEYSNEMAEFLILPIEYEGEVTFGKGASKGPNKIINASKHLEYYDEQFDIEGFEKGIKVLDSLKLNELTPEKAIKQISEEVSKHSDKFIIGLGGDHSVTIGLVNGQEKDFDVLVFDAHSDLRDSWNNSQYNHACVNKRICNGRNIGIVGVRSQDIEEKEFIELNNNIHMIKSYDFNMQSFDNLLDKLQEKVYISIDVDVFDPSFIRNTGTPEPGGFFWNEFIQMLTKVFENKNVISADIVEFSPKENYEVESFSLAKLVYKIICMKQKFK